MARSYSAIFAIALLSAGCVTTPKPMSTAYVFIFNGFKSAEFRFVEEHIVGFSGYEHHRTITSSMRQVEIWYETENSSAQINQYLRKMLDRLDIKGRVIFSGNQFKVQKIGLRRN